MVHLGDAMYLGHVFSKLNFFDVSQMLSYNAITVTDALIGSITWSLYFFGSVMSYTLWGVAEEPTLHICLKDAISTLDVIDAFMDEKKDSMTGHKSLIVLIHHLKSNMNLVRQLVADVEYTQCKHNESMFRHWSKVDCEMELRELHPLMKKVDSQFAFMMSLVRTFDM